MVRLHCFRKEAKEDQNDKNNRFIKKEKKRKKGKQRVIGEEKHNKSNGCGVNICNETYDERF